VRRQDVVRTISRKVDRRTMAKNGGLAEAWLRRTIRETLAAEDREEEDEGEDDGHDTGEDESQHEEDAAVEARAEELYQQAVEQNVLGTYAQDNSDEDPGEEDEEGGWDPIEAADKAMEAIMTDLADEDEFDNEALRSAIFDRCLAGLT
jgi:hypothetical protein